MDFYSSYNGHKSKGKLLRGTLYAPIISKNAHLLLAGWPGPRSSMLLTSMLCSVCARSHTVSAPRKGPCQPVPAKACLLNESPEEVDGEEVRLCRRPACPDFALLLCTCQLEPCQCQVVNQTCSAARSSFRKCAMTASLLWLFQARAVSLLGRKLASTSIHQASTTTAVNVAANLDWLAS